MGISEMWMMILNLMILIIFMLSLISPFLPTTLFSFNFPISDLMIVVLKILLIIFLLNFNMKTLSSLLKFLKILMYIMLFLILSMMLEIFMIMGWFLMMLMKFLNLMIVIWDFLNINLFNWGFKIAKFMIISLQLNETYLALIKMLFESISESFISLGIFLIECVFIGSMVMGGVCGLLYSKSTSLLSTIKEDWEKLKKEYEDDEY